MLDMRSKIRQLVHKSVSRASELGEEYHASDIAGVAIVFLVLGGYVARFLSLLVPIVLISTVVLGNLAAWLYGPHGPFKLAYFAFKAVLWTAIGMALLFLGTGLQVLASSPDQVGFT